jgi:hypothetical protein
MICDPFWNWTILFLDGKAIARLPEMPPIVDMVRNDEKATGEEELQKCK